jgi:hypothetical protein
MKVGQLQDRERKRERERERERECVCVCGARMDVSVGIAARGGGEAGAECQKLTRALHARRQPASQPERQSATAPC